MRSAKRFCLAAAFGMSFLAACHTSTLPDTYPPGTESAFISSPVLPTEEISSIFPSHSSSEEISFASLASSAPEEEQTSLLFIGDPSTAEYPVATEPVDTRSVDTEPVDTAPVITESVEIFFIFYAAWLLNAVHYKKFCTKSMHNVEMTLEGCVLCFIKPSFIRTEKMK